MGKEKRASMRGGGLTLGDCHACEVLACLGIRWHERGAWGCSIMCVRRASETMRKRVRPTVWA